MASELSDIWLPNPPTKPDYEDADMFQVLTANTAVMRLPDGQEGRFVLEGKLTPGQTAMGVLGSGPAPF